MRSGIKTAETRPLHAPGYSHEIPMVEPLQSEYWEMPRKFINHLPHHTQILITLATAGQSLQYCRGHASTRTTSAHNDWSPAGTYLPVAPGTPYGATARRRL